MNKIIDREQVEQCVTEEIALQLQQRSSDLTHLLPDLKAAILEVMLIHCHGNQMKAARQLGINRTTLRNWYNKEQARKRA